jgi:hypothetical protein
MALAETYYVDSSRADDSGNGTSEATAWKSLAKVNATTFQPGDEIRFKRGGVWNGHLWPKGSGNGSVNGGPIVINAYGTGARPLINGNGFEDEFLGAVSLKNQEWWEINDLEVTNNASTDGIRAGIKITAVDYGVANHIYIRNCKVRDVRATVNKELSGIYGPPIYRTGGIVVEANRLDAGSNVPSKFADLRIENNQVSAVHGRGVTLNALRWIKKGFEPNNPENYYSTGVRVTDNVITGNAGSQLLLMGADGAYVADNTLGDQWITSADPDATFNVFWTWSFKNGTIEKNILYGAKGLGEGCGLDIDAGTSSTVVQYNYFYNNAAAAIYVTLLTDPADITIRYNLIECGGAYGVFWMRNQNPETGRLNGIDFYNNTCWFPSNYAGRTVQWVDIADKVQVLENVRVRNNIFYKPSSVSGNLRFESKAGLTYNNNIYFGTAQPTDANAVTGDPLLANPVPRRLQAQDLKLRATSPAANTALTIPDSGGRDYFANAAPNGVPDIGAHERVVPLSENYNTAPTGSAPADWTINLNGAGTVSVQNVPSATDKSIRFVDNSSSELLSATRTFASQSGIVVVEFRARCDATNFFAILPRDAKNLGAGIAFNGGNIRYTTVGSAPWVTLQPFSTGIWYNFRLVIDTMADTYDIYIDNALKRADVACRVDIAAIDRINVQTGAASVVTGFIDNVRVSR